MFHIFSKAYLNPKTLFTNNETLQNILGYQKKGKQTKTFWGSSFERHAIDLPGKPSILGHSF